MKKCPGLKTIPLLVIVLATTAFGQGKVSYDISFPNAAHHEAEIAVTVERVPAGRPLQMMISRSSPGRYSGHDFARNVYQVRAIDAQGRTLAISRPRANQWDISGITAKSGFVKVSYTVFGDLGSGTYTGIDNTMAHLSMPATLMWARGRDGSPVDIRFHLPEPGWKIATQLRPTRDPMVFTAPHLQYLMDSPTMIGNIRFREWQVKSRGKSYTMRVAINDTAPDKDVDDFAKMVERVVDEQIAVFGEPADYDFGTYTFLCNYVPQIGGDGMEHRNSTSLTSGRSIKGSPRANLGTVSHEFFHSWNVERLRPRSIEPFNFAEPNVSGELWLAEGFTQYYGGLIMKRAGFGADDDGFARGLGFTVNAVLNAPGRKLHGPYDMSQRAVFEDGATGTFPNNSQNLYLSYYTYGNAVALGLDLTLRSRFSEKTLDGYMRELWNSFGRYQVNYNPARPYTLTNLEAALAKYSGDAAFARDFFARFITGNEVMDYSSLLGRAGFQMRKARAGKAWIDLPLREQGGELVVPTPTNWNSPAYKAGLDRGDVIHALDGQTVGKPSDVQTIIDRHQPGDTISIDFTQRRVKKSARITLVEDPRVEVLTMEKLNREPTPEMKKLRAEWLGTRVIGQ